MRYFIFLILLSGLFSIVSAQNRQENIEKFNDLKNQAKILEKKILSPDKKDIETALRENVGVFRILPRETYDNGLFSTRGGGAFYSFYYKIPDYGYGSDLMFEQNYLQTGISGCGLMADLEEVSLSEITKETSGAASLVNYQNAKDVNLCREDYYSAHRDGLKLGETIFKPRLPAITGHTYLVRSIVYDRYDILVAFQIRRKDADGSLVIFWKQLEQFEMPHRNDSKKTQVSDAKLLLEIKSWARPDMFPNLQAEVNNGVVILRGKISKDKIAYAVQLANSAGAIKVVNLLTVE
ncbi:MAG: BON domain-containing protein [Acidobacteriota bacterium]|nr:BON domain-containing protein [Acidobacteriota bacterium]